MSSFSEFSLRLVRRCRYRSKMDSRFFFDLPLFPSIYHLLEFSITASMCLSDKRNRQEYRQDLLMDINNPYLSLFNTSASINVRSLLRRLYKYGMIIACRFQLNLHQYLPFGVMNNSLKRESLNLVNRL